MKINEENNTPALRSLADVPDPVSRRLGGTRAVKFVKEAPRNVFQQQSRDAQQGLTAFVPELEIGEDVVSLTGQGGLPELDEARPLHAAVDREAADARGHEQPAGSNRLVRVLQQAEDGLDCAIEQSRIHGLAAAVRMMSGGQVEQHAVRQFEHGANHSEAGIVAV